MVTKCHKKKHIFSKDAVKNIKLTRKQTNYIIDYNCTINYYYPVPEKLNEQQQLFKLTKFTGFFYEWNN